MKIPRLIQMLIAIVIAESAGVVGSLFTASSVNGWYAEIVRPVFTPPAWVFGPVWTILFALMGIASFLIWEKGIHRTDVKCAIGIYVGQLVLNVLWSVIFFGLRSPGGAFIEIVFLWCGILITIVMFSRISRIAGWLLVPYIIWVSFAMYLNYAIWVLN